MTWEIEHAGRLAIFQNVNRRGRKQDCIEQNYEVPAANTSQEAGISHLLVSMDPNSMMSTVLNYQVELRDMRKGYSTIMAAVNCSELKNPTTALAFLEPDVATELEVSRYIYVASLGAFTWDLFSNVPADFQLLFEHRITLATVAYFVSRVVSLTYIVASTVFQIGSVENCQALLISLGVCFAVAVPATSLLFLFRIRAVFNDQRIVVWTFVFLWLSVLAGCITVPFAINGTHIGPTSNCINSSVKPFSSAGIVISAVNDTLVLFAISLRLVYNASGTNKSGARLKSIWHGSTLPQISKSILQSGQQYYLITVGWNVLAMAMILAPSVPPVYRAMFTIPSVAVENCMACKVYRDVKFGVIQSMNNLTIQHSSRSAVSSNNHHSRYWRRDGTKLSAHADDGIMVTTSMSRTVDPPMELDLLGNSASGRASSSYERNGESKVSGLAV
ncbi:hypothetical protein A7U60_g2464 [Sanghuangporus baumii]|uniref:Transmembrane protein n=1 Tax=Sanghuangporus baumii TaxID=108892 RepID=A0A9Q5I2K0_SANBA|nr:hypothetical protein A7U60_g2464 [Sanghuangporus baumii]